MHKRGRFALVKTTLLDYPGKVAASVFLPGCHLSCPYCQNPDFADPGRNGAELSFNSNIDELRLFLSHRARLLGGLAISGGEALLHPLLPDLINLAEEHRLPVKLDTAGLLPETLKQYLDTGRLHYVSMDLKTLPDRYKELGWKGTESESAESLLNQTMSILAGSGIDYEVRTTVVPPLVDRSILAQLAVFAASAPRWIWQPYSAGDTLNPEWSDIQAPDEDELKLILRDFKTKNMKETEIIVR